MTADLAVAGTITTGDLTVSAAGLTKRFGDREAVSGLSFDVGRGRAFGLLVPNGSGKTTTVRLLTPERGQVSLFGERVTLANNDLLRRRIGVQTDTNLYEMLSVRVGELSTGMRQKLAVGRAILHQPELLFLDEPVSAAFGGSLPLGGVATSSHAPCRPGSHGGPGRSRTDDLRGVSAAL